MNLIGSNFAGDCSMGVSFHDAGKKWGSSIKKWAFDPKNCLKNWFFGPRNNKRESIRLKFCCALQYEGIFPLCWKKVGVIHQKMGIWPQKLSKTGFLVLETTEMNIFGSDFAGHRCMRVPFCYAEKKWGSYIKKWAFDPKNSQKTGFLVLKTTVMNLFGSDFVGHCSMWVSFRYAEKSGGRTSKNGHLTNIPYFPPPTPLKCLAHGNWPHWMCFLGFQPGWERFRYGYSWNSEKEIRYYI